MRKEMVRLFLLLSVYLSGVHSLAAGRDLWQGYAGRGLRKSPSRPVVELPESLKARLLRTGTSFDLSLLHRERRGAKCGLLNDAVLEHSPTELSETAEAVQAVWVGKDVILMVASNRGSSGGTTVWRGVPNSFGLFSFSADHDAISQTVSADSLQVSPAVRSTLVVVSTSRQFLFVSRDTGRAWDHYSLPSPHFNPADDLYLSNRNPRHMVLLTEHGELYVSDSCGERWSHISAGVELAELALGRVDVKTEYLYYSTASSHSPYNPLYRLDIASRDTHVIDHTAYRFRVDGKYLFVSRQNYSRHAVAQPNTRRLYVSKNYDSPSLTFSEVQLPSLRQEQLYIVMGTHETGAFIHVADKPGEPQGNLYSSDSTGSQFSISLENHLYKVFHTGMAHISVHDFYEVESMRGVYITTTVTAGQSSHVSMITFDNGGLWAKLSPPQGSSCSHPSCSLHLHLRYSRLVAPMYNVSLSSGPLSVNTAVGIILAHGSLGPVRNEANPRLFVSSDGGYTWKDPGLPGGTYVYGIADYGNIIAVAPDSEHATFVWFSHDRGTCFVRQELDSSGVFSLNRGLLVDPTAASRFSFVMGVEGVGADDAWRVIALNFGSLLRTKCQKSDYSLVTEHATADSCLLGYKNVYNLTKPSSICYNEIGYNYNPVHVENCACDYSDYECDYGYKRTGQTCSRDGSFSLGSVCPPGTPTYSTSKSGFRLIPGDLCKPTDQSRSLLKVLQQPCTGHELPVGDSTGGGHAVKHFVNSTAGKIIGVFVIVVASLLAALLCLYCWLKWRSRSLSHEKVFYQKLPLHDSSKFSANEDSSSEDEDLINAT